MLLRPTSSLQIPEQKLFHFLCAERQVRLIQRRKCESLELESREKSLSAKKLEFATLMSQVEVVKVQTMILRVHKLPVEIKALALSKILRVVELGDQVKT